MKTKTYNTNNKISTSIYRHQYNGTFDPELDCNVIDYTIGNRYIPIDLINFNLF